MTTTKTILSNVFHGTTYTTTKSREELDQIAYRIDSGNATESERALARKIRGRLCGVSDCRCATNSFGERAK